jgi:hypothetical protein
MALLRERSANMRLQSLRKTPTRYVLPSGDQFEQAPGNGKALSPLNIFVIGCVLDILLPGYIYTFYRNVDYIVNESCFVLPYSTRSQGPQPQSRRI